MAFSFDCEIEQQENGYKAHCTSLRQHWVAIFRQQDIKELYSALIRDPIFQPFNIPPPQLKSDDDLQKDIQREIQKLTKKLSQNLAQRGLAPDKVQEQIREQSQKLTQKMTLLHMQKIEEYVCRIFSIPQVLAIPALQEFISMPDSLRQSFEFYVHSADGEELLSGILIKNYSHAKKPGVNRQFRLFKKDFGSNLRMYTNPDEEEQRRGEESVCIGVLRLGKNTEVLSLGNRVPNGFVINVGRHQRQWVIQAPTHAVFEEWVNTLQTSSGKHGPAREATAAEVPAKGITTGRDLFSFGLGGSSGGVAAATEEKKEEEYEESEAARRLKEENNILQEKAVNLQKRIEDLTRELQMLRNHVGQTDTDRLVALERVGQEMDDRRDDLIRQFETDHGELRKKVEDLYRELPEKPKPEEDPNKKEKVNKLAKYLGGDDFKEGDGRDDERVRQDEDQAPARQERRRRTFRFWHKHEQKHMHLHRHNHVHIEDEGGVVETYSATETFTHTMCHTSTRLKQKTRRFVG